MIEPISFAVGIGAALAALLAALGLVGLGRYHALRPDHVVDMDEVEAYERQKHSAEALRQDVDDE